LRDGGLCSAETALDPSDLNRREGRKREEGREERGEGRGKRVERISPRLFSLLSPLSSLRSPVFSHG